MNNKRRACSPKLELTLNLSPPRSSRLGTVLRSPDASLSSHDSSCLSCGPDEARKATGSRYSSNNGESTVTSMVLVGCPRCLMYVMLSEEANPKCPRCKSTVLLIILEGEPPAGAKKQPPELMMG